MQLLVPLLFIYGPSIASALGQTVLSNLNFQGSTQCEDSIISWEGSTPPFQVLLESVLEAGGIVNSSLPIVTYTNVTEHQLTFKMFYPTGTLVRAVLSPNGDDPSNQNDVPLSAEIIVTQGDKDDCLVSANASETQNVSETLINHNNAQVPQCSPFQVDWPGNGREALFQLQNPSPESSAASPDLIEFLADGHFINHTITFNLPYLSGTQLSLFLTNDSAFISNFTVITEHGDDSCLLVHSSSTTSSSSQTGTQTSPSTTLPSSGSGNTQGSSIPNSTKIIIGVAVPVVVLIIAGTALIIIRKRAQSQQHQTSGEVHEIDPFNQFSRVFPTGLTSDATVEIDASPIMSSKQKSLKQRLMSSRNRNPVVPPTNADQSGSVATQHTRPAVPSPDSERREEQQGGDEELVQIIRHHDGGPVPRIEELPPLYQDIRST
ncbi:hypothetical protein K435DRAFT_870417 [Dendrothele bispora CBS 962.96]|uniref:Mid2 domain-containing protein n=1 Tax=Dendrothele bispora (strain CBS 962.96) TaxID=1314807 RepID=A0A4S8L725_DENBC|nr:hypothetical protein K435DRAFT_870417 [Dendrothele bispora CBS 962.96]